MIYQIGSNLETFKTIKFQPGLNILLADKSPGATDQQTRNRAGKTSLIEIIHFLMGSNCDADSIFRNKKLIDFSFCMEFDLANAKTNVERSGKESNTIILREYNSNNWPIDPIKKNNISTITNTKWRKVLSKLMFGINEPVGANFSKRFVPTFRSMFSYFVRREREGAFISPMRQSEKQQLWDQQVALSYLIGIDWTISQQWQIIREREKSLKELRKAVNDGVFGEMIGTLADLRTRLTVSEDATRRLREDIGSFKVLPQYHAIEKEASNLTQKIAKLSDENVIDHELITDMEQSLTSEIPPAFENIDRLYQEVGVLLPENVTRRFEDLTLFHKAIIENRKLYLSSEIDNARERIKMRDRAKHDLSDRWTEVMSILKAHGALDQYTKLQSRLSKYEAETEALRQKFSAAEQLEGRKAELDVERKRLLVRLKQDFQERNESLSRAILAFQEFSSSLYEDAGNLTISDSKNGPEFEIKIHGKESKGINNMQIFCFDMMIMRLCSERGIGPGFLVHDSHLFDGVDVRQVSKALQIGAETSKRLGFQYIVTMNSDVFPTEGSSDLRLKEYVLPVRLTDSMETGGLFGMRF